jgi:hypothetical protein
MYQFQTTANGYAVCTLSKEMCKEHGRKFPCFYVLSEENAPTLSPSFSIHFAPSLAAAVKWCNRQPNKAGDFSRYMLVVTYGKGRNTALDTLFFDNRESAKEYGRKYIDRDTHAARYTIYDI